MRRSALLVVLTAFVAGAGACTAAGTNSGDGNGDMPPSGDGTGDPPLAPPRPPDINNDDAGAFGLGSRGKDAGGARPDAGRGAGDAGIPVDAGAPVDSGVVDPPDTGAAPPIDAAPDVVDTVDAGTVDSGNDSGTVVPADACPGALGASDLAIVELMIAAQTGPGDQGEWLEVQSTRACSLNLRGLHFESPRVGGTDTLDIGDDFWLPPNGIFLVADSSDPAKNHSLPAPPLWTWLGSPSDVLDNGGDTITITMGGVTVDALTYPAFQLYSGRSISFPADCAWSDRSSWARWSYSFHVWTGTFQGTPNTDNTDVACY